MDWDQDRDPAVQVSPYRAFHLFSRLPAELRLKIWSYNLPEPRVVPIRCGTKSLSLSSHARRPRPGSSGCVSSAPIPVNLHVCHESRSEALRKYKLLFGIARQPGQIFFDPDVDVLYFGPRDGYMASEAQFRTVLSLVSPKELARIRRIAINDALFWVDNSHRYISMVAASLTVDILNQIRQRMPGLEELIFVPHDENPVYSSEATFVEAPVKPSHMAHQIQTAIETVCNQSPDWKPPQWKIMAISAEPERPAPQAKTAGSEDASLRRFDEAILRGLGEPAEQ